MAISAATAILGGASLASGILGSKSAKDAASIQSQALVDAAQVNKETTQLGIDFQKDVLAQNRADLAPWTQVGYSALARLAGYRTARDAFGGGRLGLPAAAAESGFKSIGFDDQGNEQFVADGSGGMTTQAIYYRDANGNFTTDKGAAGDAGALRTSAGSDIFRRRNPDYDPRYRNYQINAATMAQQGFTEEDFLSGTPEFLDSTPIASDARRNPEYDKAADLIRQKLDAGIYQPGDAGYLRDIEQLNNTPAYFSSEAGVNDPYGGGARRGTTALASSAAPFFSDQDLVGSIDEQISFDPGAEFDAAYTYQPGKEFTNELAFEFDPSKIADDAGYQFEVQQGERGLTNLQRASGMRLSGRAIEEAQGFRQGLASTRLNEYFGRELSRYGTRVSDLMRRYGVSRDVYASEIADRARRYGVKTDKFNTKTSERDAAFSRLASLAGLGQATSSRLASSADATAAGVNAAYSGSGAAQGAAIANAGAAQAAGATNAAGSWNNSIQGFAQGLYNQQQQQQQFANTLKLVKALPGGSSASSLPAVTGTYP